MHDFRPWIGLLLLGAAACSPRVPTVEETIISYNEAVQSEDFDRLFCLSAGAADAQELGADTPERRTRFEEWARAQLAIYETGRDEGWVELDSDGIRVVKLFSLGRGTFFTHTPARRLGDDGRQVRTGLRFGYGQVDLSRASPGTTFYLGAAPAGTVRALRVPAGSREIQLEVLDAIDVDWTLVRRSPDSLCGAGWSVASVEPVEGTAVTTEMTWVF